MLERVLAIIFVIGMTGFAVFKLKKEKFNAKRLARIGMFATLTMVLYMIKLVPFPQGGGCSLLSVLPIMVLSIVVGVEDGLICAIVVALLKLVVAPPYFLMQIPLDYFGGMMALSLTPILGVQTKKRLLAGALLASFISMFFSVLSGVIFFGQYAPEGMNPWIYSWIYSGTGYGVEVVISSFVLVLLPLSSFKKALKSSENPLLRKSS